MRVLDASDKKRDGVGLPGPERSTWVVTMAKKMDGVGCQGQKEGCIGQQGGGLPDRRPTNVRPNENKA